MVQNTHVTVDERRHRHLFHIHLHIHRAYLRPRLSQCCRRVCCGAQASVASGLVTSTPAEDVRTRTPWTSVTYVITRVGADTATLGLSFLLGRHSFSHPERMPPPRGFSERRFPRQSFSKGGHRVDKTLVQGFRRKTLRAPNFGRLPSRELATFGVWTLPSQRYSVVRQKWKSFVKNVHYAFIIYYFLNINTIV